MQRTDLSFSPPKPIPIDRFEAPCNLPLDVWKVIFSFLPHSQLKDSDLKGRLWGYEKNTLKSEVYALAFVCKAFYLATKDVRDIIIREKQDRSPEKQFDTLFNSFDDGLNNMSHILNDDNLKNISTLIRTNIDTFNLDIENLSARMDNIIIDLERESAESSNNDENFVDSLQKKEHRSGCSIQ